ncbi:restriction endonuclease subunit S [Agrobacterium tumefaciens]|uniref:Restriction endonuclease subunit S n=1 Tax=Agrobacterium tumefaciens TaxID=358 RepID=A0A546Y032_AGRTU|nr:restriction endonuclease subunit S [Agrobacterium tumefaciens]TRB06349.1 restriction endonuclease subunit S [Agrobacterium tumefaciens]
MSETVKFMPLNQAVDINPRVEIKKGTEYPFVEMADLGENVTQVRSSKTKVYSGSGARFCHGDTLFARITPCLENGKIAKYISDGDRNPGFGSTEFIVFRGRNELTTNEFAHYVVTDPNFRAFAISKMNGSSGRQRVPVDALNHFEVRVPTISDQKSITKILGDLDEKIDLLRGMNKTLEELARSVFRSWFVEYEPVRARAGGATTFRGMPQNLFGALPHDFVESEIGEVPRGWEVQRLSHLVRLPIRRGIAPRYTEDGGILVLNQKCIRDSEVNFSLARRHDNIAKPVMDQQVDRLDILVNSTGVGTLGRVAQVYELYEETTADSHLSLVKPDPKKINALYLGYNLTDRESEIESLGHGSTGQTELSRHKLGELSVLVPSKECQNGFSTFLSPLIERKVSNWLEIEVLTSVRNTLLPRLISGELETPRFPSLGIKAATDDK